MENCNPLPCCPFYVSRTEELASSTLPDSGAFTSQSPTVLPVGISRVTYWVTYTRGAPAGAPVFKIEWGNGTDTSREVILEPNSLVVTANGARVKTHLEELVGQTPPDANPVSYILEFIAPAAATSVRLLAAEFGATGTPGTIAIALTAKSSE